MSAPMFVCQAPFHRVADKVPCPECYRELGRWHPVRGRPPTDWCTFCWAELNAVERIAAWRDELRARFSEQPGAVLDELRAIKMRIVEMAQMLGISARTINRRLAEQKKKPRFLSHF